MNPRGRQFALGGTVHGWVRLQRPHPRQERLLRRVYRGLEPRTLSRYGIRQLAAATPWTRTIVKDPFALLSIPAIVRISGAHPVLLYRNPCAVLASYRRMGWHADLAEVVALGAVAPPTGDARLADASAMAAFWSFLNEAALEDIAGLPYATVVSHEDLMRGGDAAVGRLRHHLGLPAARARTGEARANGPVVGLHHFDRERDEVLHGWRAKLSAEEIALMETMTRRSLDQLERARLRLLPTSPPPAPKEL